MDPDKTLQAGRQAISDWEHAPDLSREEWVAAEMIGSALGALDAHLSEGGSLPRDWARGSLPARDELVRVLRGVTLHMAPDGTGKADQLADDILEGLGAAPPQDGQQAGQARYLFAARDLLEGLRVNVEDEQGRWNGGDTAAYVGEWLRRQGIDPDAPPAGGADLDGEPSGSGERPVYDDEAGPQ